MKRFVSVFLVLLLSLFGLYTGVSASNAIIPSKIPFQTDVSPLTLHVKASDAGFTVSKEQGLLAANFLASKKIIANNSNTPDTYRLSDPITRKESMKIIANLAGVVPENKCEGKFSDVEKDWGCKYIEWALNSGYIAGNGKFRPNDNITEVEALKLIFKAKGIKNKYQSSNWQADYYQMAVDAGIYFNTFPNISSSTTVSDLLGSDALRGWIFFASAKTFSDFASFNNSKKMSNEATVR